MVHRTQVPTDDSAAPDALGPAAPSVRMVFVCRANRCRSPLAEHLTRRRAGQQGLGVLVGSVGFLASGLPTPRTGVRAAAEHGLDLSAHTSRRLEAEHWEQADVILASARAEARDLVAELPQLWPKVYTLKQFAAHTAAHPVDAGTDLGSWVAAAGRSRSRSVLLGSHPDDDVADPMGKSIRAWRATIGELDELISGVLSSCAAAIPKARVRAEQTGR